eukprot:g30528.t1
MQEQQISFVFVREILGKHLLQCWKQLILLTESQPDPIPSYTSVSLTYGQTMVDGLFVIQRCDAMAWENKKNTWGLVFWRMQCRPSPCLWRLGHGLPFLPIVDRRPRATVSHVLTVDKCPAIHLAIGFLSSDSFTNQPPRPSDLR